MKVLIKVLLEYMHETLDSLNAARNVKNKKSPWMK